LVIVYVAVDVQVLITAEIFLVRDQGDIVTVQESAPALKVDLLKLTLPLDQPPYEVVPPESEYVFACYEGAATTFAV
jgi:hypothetical protein